MADAAVDTVRSVEGGITVLGPDGRVASQVVLLLASNNPYRFIGPPDFAIRPALDTGTLGVALANRQSMETRGPATFTRWVTPSIVVDSDLAEIRAGVDGELKLFEPPIDLTISPRALRVIVPIQTQVRGLRESMEHLNERAFAYISGLPPIPDREELTKRSPVLERLHRVDEAMFERVAGWESPVMDRTLPALSEAASHSKIWIALAFVMSAFGNRKGRTTAATGLAAVGITSLLANVVAKSLLRRQRPTNSVPEERRLPTPSSPSMPSGHTASAAAFTGVVGAAYPGLRGPLNALAGAVGFSRVYTGVHYPGLVDGGWLLGRGIAGVTLMITAVFRRLRSGPSTKSKSHT